MSKQTLEEIREKWIRHKPLISLDDAVKGAMEEYARQFQQEQKPGEYYTKEDMRKAYACGQNGGWFQFEELLKQQEDEQ